MNSSGTARPRQTAWRTLTVILAMLLTAMAMTPATAQPNTDPDIEQSVLFISITWRGFINYEIDSGYTWSDEVEATNWCTGFYVSTTGHIATAGHCVDPAGGKESLIDEFLDDLVADDVITESEKQGLLPTALANWIVEGQNNRSDPVRDIKVIQPADDAPVDDWLTVSLTDFRPFESGDVAILKGEVDGTTPLPLATEDPATGAAVTSIGYPGDVTGVVDLENLEATFASGTVSGRQTIGGASRTQVNTDMAGGMSGGPTVDENGNVVGVNSSGIDNGQNYNFVTDTTDFMEWVSSHGIQPAPPNQSRPTGGTTPGPEPEHAPSGSSGGMPVWAWILIGLGALVVLALVAVLVRLAKRPATPLTPVGAPTTETLPDEDRAAYESWKRLQDRQ